MRVDHATLEKLHARARRERAETVWRLLVAPVIRFFTQRPAPVQRHAPLRSRLA